MNIISGYNFTNIIKRNFCFKRNGSSIDLILTNRKHSFTFSSYLKQVEVTITLHAQCLKEHFRERETKSTDTP